MNLDRLLRTLAALALLTSVHANAALVIDDFSTDQGPVNVSPSGPSSASSSAAGPGMLGGGRDLSLSTASGPSVLSSEARVQGGHLIMSNNSQFQSSLMLQWDGPDNSSALDALGLGGVDLTGGGTTDAFEIRFVFDDLPATLELTVHTDGANASSFLFPSPGFIFTDLSLYIPFAAFTGNADFTNVGAIELRIDSPLNGLDIEIDYLQTVLAPVPIPAAWLLFGGALAVISVRRSPIAAPPA